MSISRAIENRSRRRRADDRSAPPARDALRVLLLLFVLAAPASFLAVSCAPGGADVEGRWAGSLALNYGAGYDVELNLEQDGEDLSGNGTLVSRDTGEDGGQVDVVEGSRVEGGAIDLVLRDATGYAGLRIDLQGTAEEERIEAEGTFRASSGVAQSGLAARLELSR